MDNAAPVVPLPLNDAAGGNTVRELEIPMSALHPDVTAHGKGPLACPRCGQLKEERRMFEHFKQEHPDEARLDYFLTIGKQKKQLLIYGVLSNTPTCQFQMDHGDIIFDNRWPWTTGTCEFSVRFSMEDCLYLSDNDEKLMDELDSTTKRLFSLLKPVRPHFDWGCDSGVEHIFVKIDMLWKLSISIWASGWVHDLASHPEVLQIRNSIPARLLRLAYDLQQIHSLYSVSDHSLTQQEALAFVSSVRRNHLNELNELIHCMVSLELLLHTCPMLQDLYKP